MLELGLGTVTRCLYCGIGALYIITLNTSLQLLRHLPPLPLSSIPLTHSLSWPKINKHLKKLVVEWNT